MPNKIRKKGERPSELKRARGTGVPAAAWAVLVGIAAAGVGIWIRAPLVGLSSARALIGQGRPDHPPPDHPPFRNPWQPCLFER
jgi:hypothetical protein